MDTNNKIIKIIARGSRLSKIQVEEFKKKFPEIRFETEYVSSFGDKNQEISLLNGEAPDDMFTRELDRAIIDRRADIAVHSAKDLPQNLNPQIRVVALYEAFDKTDSLVSRDNIKLADLPAGSKIGTSSPLRKKELLALRPDIEIVGIRGCIEDRVNQVRSGKIDAAIVATCALKRLGMENEIAEILPFETHPMQGRLAVTCRKDDNYICELLKKGSIL
jgi:hydroxymethylbilane synthase